MMKKPIIGITPDYSYEKTRFKISEDYTNALLKAGGVPVLLFPGEDFPDFVDGILFTGDHVLFDISPNITPWNGMEDALGCYLDSLRAVRELPARLALPGHRRPGALAPRVDALLEHHARRLDELTAILRARPGSTAYEAAAHMTWNIRSRSWDDFPLAQKWFAVGECIAHLDHLRRQGRLQREQQDGVWHAWAL